MAHLAIVKLNRPRFSAQDACSLARQLYGLTVSARPLPSERDQNFHLTDEAGQQYVLKISSSAEQGEVLRFQHQAIEHLAAHMPSGLWPRIYTTAAGEQITAVEGSDGRLHLVRMLSYLPGRFLAEVKPHTPELLHSLGRFLGEMDRVLEGFSHPAMHRDLKWNLQHAPATIRQNISYLPTPERRALIEHFLSQFEKGAVPVLPRLRTSVIHNDGNDYNVLLSDNGLPGKEVISVIDFGDMLHSYTVAELAVAAAYAMLDKPDPIAAAAHITRGYHQSYPLTEAELEALFHLICLRLCLSVSISAEQREQEPENEYLSISERAAWALLEQLAELSPELAHYTFRHACDLPPCPHSDRIVRWLKSNREKIGRVVGLDLKTAPKVVFDLSVGSPELSNPAEIADAQALTNLLFGRMKAEGAEVGIGRYNEARLLYTNEIFKLPGNDSPQWRTVHLGIDLFMKAGAEVFAPLDGTVHSFQNNARQLDYGPTIILKHEFEEGRIRFFTLYGHLSEDSLQGLYEGRPVKKGQQIARIGDYPINGGWAPHLHFQLITDLLGKKGDFPGVALPAQREVWLSLSPDPNLILGIPEECFPPAGRSRDEILQLRRQHIGRSLSIAYKKPLQIVRGWMQYLYDEEGRVYLDAVNNVPHVGHCHPRVVRAAQQQMAVLNTNTRYLYDHLVRYAERLCALLPEPLSVCFFVNSGSEANDLALRLARTHTKRRDVIVLDGAYHGNLTSLIEISPYKFDGPGGAACPAHVHKVVMPDLYRGPYRADDPEAGSKYARHVQEAIERAGQQGRAVAAFICESLLGCGGQIVLPDGYLKEAYRYVRKAGGVCIADEVQVGFGRVGTHFWAFETQGVVPDIVTLGKPIGNGHPLGAVITTPEIAESFNNGMEYFNTFGGNPVSCAVGLAVLDVIEDEKLLERALQVGTYLKAGLERLMEKYQLIGDVRGLGLFLGVELVLNRERREAATAQAAYIVERMKDRGILISTDGPLRNVLKIKPPLVFSEADADWLLGALDQVLAEL
jgi:4-aminobutyrate aminotransferase-like enzyme/Ser/Thr protein kinase RdoA (MazF antagonist)